MIRMLAMLTQALELSIERSRSLANRRHLPNQPNVRSTTQRRGRTWNPFAVSDRLMISIVQPPDPFIASRNLSPA